MFTISRNLSVSLVTVALAVACSTANAANPKAANHPLCKSIAQGKIRLRPAPSRSVSALRSMHQSGNSMHLLPAVAPLCLEPMLMPRAWQKMLVRAESAPSDSRKLPSRQLVRMSSKRGTTPPASFRLAHLLSTRSN